MKTRTTLFNANQLALMHGLSLNPVSPRVAAASAAQSGQDNVEKRYWHGRYASWRLFLLQIVTKVY